MVAKKKKRKKKIKVFRVFLVLVVITLLVLLVMFLGKVKVRGFYISGNTYYDDQKILNITGLDKYPSFLLTNSYTINSKIKDEKLINNIKIKKTLDGKFKVIVTENKILFYDSNKNKSVITDGSLIDYYYERSMLNLIGLGITFLAFNYDKYIYIKNIRNKIKLTELEDYLKNI